jgi:hypothetical protein
MPESSRGVGLPRPRRLMPSCGLAPPASSDAILWAGQAHAPTAFPPKDGEPALASCITEEIGTSSALGQKRVDLPEQMLTEGPIAQW